MYLKFRKLKQCHTKTAQIDRYIITILNKIKTKQKITTEK
jgi:hypothetical protein